MDKDLFANFRRLKLARKQNPRLAARDRKVRPPVLSKEQITIPRAEVRAFHEKVAWKGGLLRSKNVPEAFDDGDEKDGTTKNIS